MNKTRKIVAIIFLSLLFILTACKKEPVVEEYKIPNLANLNQQQIIEKFNEMDIQVNLEFRDFFEPAFTENTFWELKSHKVGDTIENNEHIVIYLAQSKITLKDLSGLNRTEIIEYFTEIGVPTNLINLKPIANAEGDDDLFVRYDGYQINQKHDFTEGALTIYYKDGKLPNLVGLNETQITELFNERNITVTLDFQLYFDANGNNTFKEYINKNVGDEFELGEVVSIYLSSKTITLPNLRGLTKDEAEEALIAIGLPQSLYSFQGDVNLNVGKDEFIRYGNNHSAGQQFSPTTQNKIVVYYNISSEVPNLEGLNKYQIEEKLKAANISVIEFEYVLDNTKEFNFFAGYGNKEAGEMIDPSNKIIVKIYENNDVNVGELIRDEYQLFISKYIDGEGSNKALELFNPTNEAINLSNYYLTILTNGSFVPTYEILLTGTLNPNETFVIVNELADANLLDKADLTHKNILFDGNDTIQLRKVSNNTYIDSIYHVGNISSTLNSEVFVRREHITAGNRMFYQTDWFSFIPTYDEGVGTHPFTGDERPKFELIADKTFQQYGMTKVKLLSVADGDTIYVESLDPRDTTSYTGNSRLRFLLVDTPETQKPGVTGQPYANVATALTSNVLNLASEIYIQSDPAAGLTETYGRHLALIWFHLDEDYTFEILKDKDGNSVVIKAGWSLLNYELVRLGLGEKNSGKTLNYQLSPIYSNRYLYSWVESALLYAQENELGLYSGVHMN